MSSSSWLYVAKGLQIVTTAIVKNTSKDLNINSIRLTQHAVGVTTNLRTATRATAKFPSDPNVGTTTTATTITNDGSDNDTSSSSVAYSAPSTSSSMMNSSSSSLISPSRSATANSNVAKTITGNQQSEKFLNNQFQPKKVNANVYQNNYDEDKNIRHDSNTRVTGENKIVAKDDEFSLQSESSSTSSTSTTSSLIESDTTDSKGGSSKSTNETSKHKQQEVVEDNNGSDTISTPAGDATKDGVENYQHRLKEGRPVPSTRIGRAVGFASLGAGLALGTAVEMASRLLSKNIDDNSNNSSASSSNAGSILVGTDKNADLLASSLCRMRGAALKLGQMLSIQDESLMPEPLVRALRQVRQGADAMPEYQLKKQIRKELGDGWEDKFNTFDKVPFAAASIGQVHRGTILRNSNVVDVVMKVQYPGVGNSIDSDLNNLKMLVTMTGLAPKGLFIDNVIRVGRDELTIECNYEKEQEHQKRFKALVENDTFLHKESKFVVPDVIDDLSTKEILTTEYAYGGTIDKVSTSCTQDERNRIGRAIMYLTMQELFVWRFMQTDPNWGNFLYDINTGVTTLVDFGACREYSKSFVDGYLRIVWAAANKDSTTIMDQSHKMGFLTGEENDIMLNAHKLSGFTVGEPFQQTNNNSVPFDFRGSKISSRLSQHSSAFMQHRLTPPPEEVYTLHRKLAGAYMLCIKLGSIINCRDLLEDVVRNHSFDDGQPPPGI